MHDALSVEKLGIPAAAVITDRFVQTARLIAEFNGMQDYPFVVIAHPIADNDDETIRAKAAAAVRQCVELLTRRAAGPAV